MAKRYTQVPISYLEQIFEQWRSAYNRGELVNVFFIPKGDILFRAMQFIDWVSDRYGDKVKLVNFETELVFNQENLREALANSKDEKMLLLARREFLQPDAGPKVAVLDEWYAREGKGALVFHEGFPVEFKKYAPTMAMAHKIFVHKIYPKHVIREYISSTAILLGVTLTTESKELIADYCGGIPWLINDVLRRLGEDNIFTDDTFLWKVDQIVRAIPNIGGIETDLLEFELKDAKGNWIPALAHAIEKISKSEMVINESEIIWKSRDYTYIFSPGERRIMNTLYVSEGVSTRERLGELFWQDRVNDEYSDWALDAIVSRLRKKLVKVGLPIKIVTRRGSGYSLSR